jgi:hypothetical protein
VYVFSVNNPNKYLILSHISIFCVDFYYIVPKAKIHGNREIYIKSGNDINLTCSTNEFTSPPSFIYWYKGLKVINYSQRGGINVSTDRSTKTSNLIIKHATHPADSGNYTCAPSNSGKINFNFTPNIQT